MSRRRAILAKMSEDGTLYLYNAGNENTAMTGGWGSITPHRTYADKYGFYESDTQASAITKNTSNILVNCKKTSTYANTGARCIGTIYTNNSIDTTQYSSLKISGTSILGSNITSGDFRCYIAMHATQVTNQMIYSDGVVCGQINNLVAGTNSIEITVDISALTGLYYVAAGLNAWGNTSAVPAVRSFTIDAIWLE